MNRMTDKIHKLGLKLPKPFIYPSPNRTGCVVTGNLVYTSGHPPPSGFGVAVHGKVGGDIAEQEAVSSAQAAALSILASVEQQVGSLAAIKQVVKVTGLVNSAPGFMRQFAVVDGASNLFVDLFGPSAGQHARSAIGVFELPRQFCMEIEAIFELSNSNSR